MKSGSARDIYEKGLLRQTERASGSGRNVLDMAASRAADLTIASLGHLPAAAGQITIQHINGGLLYLMDFSAMDGGNVML